MIGKGASIQGLASCPNGRHVAAFTSTGRALALKAGSLEVVREFAPPDDGGGWSSAAFVGNGGFVALGHAHSHRVSIFSVATGLLARTLQGPNDKDGGQVLAVVVRPSHSCSTPALLLTHSLSLSRRPGGQGHPLRAILLTVCRDGSVVQWSNDQSTRWSAFAPEFEELEENEEYEEAEDEFDLDLDETSMAPGTTGARQAGRKAISPLRAPTEASPVDIVTCSLPKTVADALHVPAARNQEGAPRGWVNVSQDHLPRVAFSTKTSGAV